MQGGPSKIRLFLLFLLKILKVNLLSTYANSSQLPVGHFLRSVQGGHVSARHPAVNLSARGGGREMQVEVMLGLVEERPGFKDQPWLVDGAGSGGGGLFGLRPLSNGGPEP